MGIRESEEATVTAIWESFRWAEVGLMTYSPSIYPTETPEIGPFQGISEILNAMEEGGAKDTDDMCSAIAVTLTGIATALAKENGEGRGHASSFLAYMISKITDETMADLNDIFNYKEKQDESKNRR